MVKEESKFENNPLVFFFQNNACNSPIYPHDERINSRCHLTSVTEYLWAGC